MEDRDSPRNIATLITDALVEVNEWAAPLPSAELVMYCCDARIGKWGE